MSVIYIHTISSSEGPCPSTPTQLGTSSTVGNRYWRIMTSSFFAEFDVTRTGTDTDAQMHAMLLCSHSQQE